MIISKHQVTDIVEGKTLMEKPGFEKLIEVFMVGMTSDNLKSKKNKMSTRVIWAISYKGKKILALEKY